MPDPRVLVVGDVINDVVVRPREAVTLGSDTLATIARTPGGSAANFSCWLAALGVQVDFVARVGAADQTFHEDFLRGFGVRPHLSADPARDTGAIVIVVSEDGARTMYTDRGANLALAADDIPEHLLASAGVLHLTGYTFFEPELRAHALALLERARALGVPVSIDPSSSAWLTAVGPEQFLAWTAGADVVFPNRDEARVLTGLHDPMLAASQLGETYRCVVVTLDGDGCVVVYQGGAPVAMSGPRVDAVDTTGAGDAFSAGFLAAVLAEPGGLAAPEPTVLEPAVLQGCAIAGRVVTRLGARPIPGESVPQG